MKKLFLLLLASGSLFAQTDMKEASSEKPSLTEGMLRDAKPFAERKLADGTEISVWTIPSGTKSVIAKASATRQTPMKDEGMRTEKADFSFADGIVSQMHYSETRIVQKPAPSVSSSKKDVVFANGLQSSPSPGIFPELDQFISDCLSEIAKIPIGQ